MATTTLIRIAKENILFDAGRGVMVQLSKAGMPLGAINTVFLTHHHFDHIRLTSWKNRCAASCSRGK
ncbi:MULTISPECIES: MBL fold metallo-hydrolase [Bradyrhizobium]|uniref:MBL fold metallo-hydrolase n=1 Tax=Bradyrhizobium TaxID=374 RepID=UPI001EDB238E|nr:MBL fold metallo-hydrolase [Bradyrhizobium zhengyangense]MCG2645568.1 MBL fold metallo-hydrolase [Bradyrhizobium zhengyangense]